MICYNIKNNIWQVISNEIAEFNDKLLLINNSYPINFYTKNNKKFFSCNFCNKILNKEIWYNNTENDYHISCYHIKKLLLAIEYNNINNSDRNWPTTWPKPNNSDIKLYQKYKEEIFNPNKKQIFYPDIKENLKTLEPMPQYYDCINFCDNISIEYTIIKHRGIFFSDCNCNNSNCIHIKYVKNFEKKIYQFKY